MHAGQSNDLLAIVSSCHFRYNDCAIALQCMHDVQYSYTPTVIRLTAMIRASPEARPIVLSTAEKSSATGYPSVCLSVCVSLEVF